MFSKVNQYQSEIDVCQTIVLVPGAISSFNNFWCWLNRYAPTTLPNQDTLFSTIEIEYDYSR